MLIPEKTPSFSSGISHCHVWRHSFGCPRRMLGRVSMPCQFKGDPTTFSTFTKAGQFTYTYIHIHAVSVSFIHTLHYITLHCIALHSLHYITLHYIIYIVRIHRCIYICKIMCVTCVYVYIYIHMYIYLHIETITVSEGGGGTARHWAIYTYYILIWFSYIQ